MKKQKNTTILIIDNNTDDLEFLLHACKRHDLEYNIKTPSELTQSISNNYDIILLTGGYWYDNPTQQNTHYENELKLISSTNKPIIGICLGMQLIANVFDEYTAKLRHEQHGKRHIKLTQQGKEELELPEDLVVFENHTIGVGTVSDSFDVLAKSDECLEIIRHKIRPLIGVQFHPEKLNKQENADKVWSAILKSVNRTKNLI